MPQFPDIYVEWGLDPDTPGGRFTSTAAIAIATGEYGDGDAALADEVIRSSVGDWLLEPDEVLGSARAEGGSAGRGAAGWVAVVQWLGEAIANNVVDIAFGAALAKIVGRLREWRRERESDNKVGHFMLSRGAAALLAAADVAVSFGEHGPLEVEAVEEPSSIAGHEVSELSYVGLEPWIVFLRNMETGYRYLVVVMPDGSVAGRLQVPFLEFEAMFLRPSNFKLSIGD